MAPRSLDSIRRLVEEATGASTPVPFDLTPVPVPEGAPVDPATVDGVNATLRELYACSRSVGDNLSATALYTDAYLARAEVTYGPYSDAELPALATPEPTEVGHIVYLVPAEDVRRLPDGRIGALVTPAFVGPNARGTEVGYYLIFVKVGDRYLIDEERYIAADAPTPVAAPTSTEVPATEGVGRVRAGIVGVRRRGRRRPTRR